MLVLAKVHVVLFSDNKVFGLVLQLHTAATVHIKKDKRFF